MEAPPAPPPAPPTAEVADDAREITLTTPEVAFAARVPAPEPERPFPATRRAIFFDVENTSRAEHIARMLDHLAVDRTRMRTDFVAVGNWRVIGHDTARLLARRGAQLVHSAPAVGIRDWSDLRIAVAAGAWLASARPGDVVEIVSDDRAFEAVGDVAASLGIEFRRLSYRALAGVPAGEAPPREVLEPDLRSRGRRRGRRRGPWRERPEAAAVPSAPAHVPAPPPVREPIPPAPAPVTVNGGNGVVEPQTAPHDEIVEIARELIARSPAGAITIDALANALKSRGFRRPPGSPRLITRLRRIKELSINRAGQITLIDATMVNGALAQPEAAETFVEPIAPAQPAEPVEPIEAPRAAEAAETVEAVPAPDVVDAEVEPVAEAEAVTAGAPERPRRRTRRGGRRRRGPRPAEAATAEAAAAEPATAAS